MSTSTAASKPEPQTMSVRDLKGELQAGGVNTSGMLYKEDLTAAVKNLRTETSASAEATSPQCSHCGKKGVALKKCSRCMQVSYCGAECQKAAWKGHKGSCVEKLDLREVFLTPLNQVDGKVRAGVASGDWREVLKWEARVEEMIEHDPTHGEFMLGAELKPQSLNLKS